MLLLKTTLLFYIPDPYHVKLSIWLIAASITTRYYYGIPSHENEIHLPELYFSCASCMNGSAKKYIQTVLVFSSHLLR